MIEVWRLRFTLEQPRDTIRAATRATLLALLADVAGCSRERLHLEADALGKLRLRDRRDVRFNVSHSGRHALIAIALDLDVGIDVERHDCEGACERALRRYFTPAEVEEIDRLDPGERTRAVHEAWTRKEACLKATGAGLAGGLGSFTVPIGRLPGPRTVAVPWATPCEWSVRDLDLGDGVSAAVVWAGTTDERVRVRDCAGVTGDRRGGAPRR